MRALPKRCTIALAAALLIAVASLAGCGDDDAGPGTEPTPAPTTQATSTAPEGEPGEATTRRRITVVTSKARKIGIRLLIRLLIRCKTGILPERFIKFISGGKLIRQRVYISAADDIRLG